MTQQFVTAFLTTCFEAGLSKEAAAALLQKESADRAMQDRPAFAEAYIKRASTVPGQLRPVLLRVSSTSEFEKAALMRGLGQAGKALLWDLPVGLGRALMGAGKQVGKGVGRTFGPQKTSLLERYPFAVGVGGMGAAAAGTYGLTNWLGQDKRLIGSDIHDPFLPPGGYSREQYNAMYDNRLKEHEPGIFNTNKEYDSSAGRIKELEQAVSEGRADGNAYQELANLQRSRAVLGSGRNDYLNQLELSQRDNQDLIQRITGRKQDLETQRNAWWAAPKRWLMRYRGGDLMDSSISDREFDRQIGALTESASRAGMQSRLAADRAKLLSGGATGRSAPQRSAEQLTTDFFPTY